MKNIRIHNPKPHKVLSRRSMRLIRLLAAVAIAAAILIGRYQTAGTAGRHDDETDRQRYHQQSFRVLHVVDGDTLDVDAADGPERYTRIRLWGVDTPETKHPNMGIMYYGLEASAFARETAEGKTVTLGLEPVKPTRDKYGRLLAYVYLPDGRMLNELLIEQGYGYADPRFDHVMKKQFMQLEKQAQLEKRGLWKDVRPDQMPQWRQEREKIKSKSE
jgi:micrococcal nuclease